MPRINLLPWREGQRRERKLKFLVALGGATVAAAVFTFGAYLMFSSTISGQMLRNEQLRAEIRHLDKQIEEINGLEASKQQARMLIAETKRCLELFGPSAEPIRALADFVLERRS